MEALQKQGHHRFFYALIYRAHAHFVIDVGGEDSALISKILKAVPNARETLFNRAHMVTAARRCIEKDSEPQRVDFIVGDPFKPLSQRGDVYLFSRILAKLSGNKGRKILQNRRISMNDTSARLLSFDRPVKRT